jgi:probable rRNA maturation factor
VTLELEIVGEAPVPAGAIEALVARTLASAAIADGHLAIEFVSPSRVRELNRDHRHIDEPTDVLSFPIDGAGAPAGPRELGDVVICPEHTSDIREAIVHGVLHLLGMDHETDRGEMLARQRELLL